jgi:uncharacterized membrane protein
MEYLLAILLIVFVVGLLVVHSRLRDLEERLSRVDRDEEQIGALTARVHALEQRSRDGASVAQPPPRPVMEPVAEVRETPQPVDVPRPVTVPEPVVVTATPPPLPPPPLPPPAVPPPLPVFVAPGPSWSDRLRQSLGNEEWEALVGGSILNKIGAVVLVIGIALFLGYSFARMGPAGKASVSIALSFAALATGVYVERKATYRTFARGLIGAGWAGLYATSYAIYALPAARIIENPFAGSVIILLVAAGMIAHSLRYRAQAVTGVAYAAAFAALAATPSTPFAVMSLIPLAASILYLATAFEWTPMALFGMVATYATCISRGDSNAPLASTQTLFLAYWVMFEAFDLLRVRRRVLGGGVEWIFPLNSTAFLGLSYLAWSHHAPDLLWLASAYAAALYLATAIVRAVIRPPSSFDANDSLLVRLRAGSYEGALLFAVVLAALAVVGRVPGVWKSVGLAIEAELIYLAGVRFRARFLRRLGGRAFAVSLATLAWHNFKDYPLSAGKTAIFGRPIWNCTPPALFHAFLFYANRGLFRAHSAFSYSAAGLIMLVLGAECPVWFVGTAWLLLATVLFEIGARTRLRESRVQAYGIAASGAIVTAMFHAGGAPHLLWIPLAASLALVYANVLRNRFLRQHSVEDVERTGLSWACAVSTAVLSVLLLWRTVPADYVALSWCMLAVVLFELALRRLPAELRAISYVVALFGGGAVVMMHTEGFAKFPAAAVAISWFGASACAWAFTARAASDREQSFVRDLAAVAGTLLVLPAVWLVVPDVGVAICWAALAIAWLELGFLLKLASFRWLGNAILLPVAIWELTMNLPNPHLRLIMMSTAAAVFCYAWLRSRKAGDAEGFAARLHLWAAATLLVCLLYAELPVHAIPAGWMLLAMAVLFVGTRYRISDLRFQSYVISILAFGLAVIQVFSLQRRLPLTAAVIAALYLSQFLSESSERRARAMFSLLGTALLTVLLYHEVSGGLLTVACAVEGVALLAAGFPLRERVLRLQGLVLLLACILKLFLYDLRNLETMYRILSFVALGLILLAVSWVYTRFRGYLHRIL